MRCFALLVALSLAEGMNAAQRQSFHPLNKRCWTSASPVEMPRTSGT